MTSEDGPSSFRVPNLCPKPMMQPAATRLHSKERCARYIFVSVLFLLFSHLLFTSFYICGLIAWNEIRLFSNNLKRFYFNIATKIKQNSKQKTNLLSDGNIFVFVFPILTFSSSLSKRLLLVLMAMGSLADVTCQI